MRNKRASVYVPGMADVGTPRQIGDRIRRIRLERRLSPTVLAAAVGVSERTYRGIETGRSPNVQSVARLAVIADVLGVEVSVLIAPKRTRVARRPQHSTDDSRNHDSAVNDALGEEAAV